MAVFRAGSALARASALVWVLALSALIQGCGTLPAAAPPDAPERVLPDHVPSPELDELPAPRPVAVVLSSDNAHYRRVADALGAGTGERYVLSSDNGDRVLSALRQAGHRQAIAIGQQALTVLAATELEVAYCQVFDPHLDGSRPRPGVAALPDFGAQLDQWRLRQPALRRIGLITGPAHAEVGDRLEAAARSRALTLRRAVARSDRELLYVFRRMVPAIEGFVLYPDTSILSPAVIRELLGYARKHDVWVLTYNRAIFELGAALLVSADPREVAIQVLAALHGGSGGLEAPLRRVVMEAAYPTADGG